MSLKEKLYLLKKLIHNFRKSLSKDKQIVQIPVNMKRIRKIILDLKKHFNPFELENLNQAIVIPGTTADKIIDLYLEKLIAIHYEDYEKAAQLSTKIETYQQKLENQKNL
jgi:hypothetical protein